MREWAWHYAMMGLAMIMPIEKVASGGSSPPPGGGNYIVEDASGNYITEDASGNYITES